MLLGMSERARVTTNTEASFRISYPNSRPRKSCIIALDEASFEILKGLATSDRFGAHFLRYVAPRPVSDMLQMLNLDATLEDVNGNQVGLVEEITDADVIVMVTSAGAQAEAAEIIGVAAFVRNKTTTGLVLNSGDAETGDLMRTLRAMRPFAAMLVVSTDDDHIAEMLTALRA
jgi:hypothetical protein